jgi:hypothetical protein
VRLWEDPVDVVFVKHHNISSASSLIQIDFKETPAGFKITDNKNQGSNIVKLIATMDI